MWLRADCTYSFDLHVFITSCLSCSAIFFIEMVDVKEEQVCINFASNLAGVQQKLIKWLNKHLVMMLGSHAILRLV